MKFRSHHNLFAMRLLATHALFTAAFLMCMTFVSTNAVAQEHKDDDHAKAHAHDDDHAHEDGHDHKDDDHHTEKAGHGDGKHGEGDHGDGHHGDDHHGAPHIWEDSAFWSIIAFAGFCFAIVKLGLWKSLHVNMAAREQKENDLIAINRGLTDYGTPPEKLVALYPKEGTFWHEHPFGIPNASWVSDEGWVVRVER